MRKMVIDKAKKTNTTTSQGKRGIEVEFSINRVIEVELVYFELEGVNRFFKIQDVCADSTSLNLNYTAFECGYSYDKVSTIQFLDIRNLIGKELFVLEDEEETKKILSRSRLT